MRGVWFLVTAILLTSLSTQAALQWESGSGYRAAPLPGVVGTKTGFALMPTSATGVQFTNVLPEARVMMNANLLNGSGVALGDFDGDGLCDIYLCDLNGTNALYRNLGDWRFSNVTAIAGVACPGQTSTGAVFADLDGDGDLDLLVTSMGGPNACFRNEGLGRFTNVTAAAGLESRLGSSSMALGDVDGNGTLDLYVANYGATSLLRSGGALSYRMVDGKPVVTGRHARRIKVIEGRMFELGEPDVLYLNNGKGVFQEVSWTNGAFLDAQGKPMAEAPWDQGLTVLFRDFNGDRAPDIYMCNDASTPDRFWLNDGHGRFRAINPLAQRQTSYYAMSADSADLDRDGETDFMVLDMLSRNHRLRMGQMSEMHPQPRRIGDIDNQPQVRRNTLFRARGDGTYAEIAQFSGLSASEWSWSVIFLDVDLDGWEDALIVNGFAYDMDNLDARDRIRGMGRQTVGESRRNILMFPRLETPNVIFRNQHDLTFQEVGHQWGFDSTQVCNGMALADLDNDGDLDVVVNCLNGQALLYRNEATSPRLAVRLKGKSPNTQGIGSRIKVLGGPVLQSQEIICGGRYVSGDDPMRVFATGAATNLTLEVTWRGGGQSVIAGARPGFVYEIDEAGAREAPPSKPSVPSPIFRDATQALQHMHHEEPYDETSRQPLLPKMLSQAGPGLAWCDLNGDGFDDLALGTGRGGQLGIYLNNGKGGFERRTSPVLDVAQPDDLGGIVALTTSQETHSILAALGNYETSPPGPASVLRYTVTGQAQSMNIAAGDSLPGTTACSGALALSDINQDGQLDLFVGGRVSPGRYPEPSSSRIYRGLGGRFQLDEPNSRTLENIGLVNSGCFADLNGDGWPDLVLACDWGPVRVFLNQAGTLVERTRELGFSTNLGWWNGVSAGDFDGDGRLDLIVSNWGRNTRYEQQRTKPLRLYYGDLDQSGSLDIIEACFNAELGKYVPERMLEWVSIGLPRLRDRVRTHADYGQGGVEDLFGESLKAGAYLEANGLDSTLFLNRGDHFEPRPLPTEAQLAPAFGICIGDFDGDGNEDVFLAQNFFATTPDTSRYDAGRGLWLRGDGRGGLSPVSAQESGVAVYGEQRGCALADFDQDGRVDLVVSQNGAATRLFQNTGARPGLRVRLNGPPGNPSGIGAVMRLYYGNEPGPAREVHAGSGYWSQDSAVQVLGMSKPATGIWVRWPGGKISTKPISSGQREITVSVRD